MTRLRAQTHHLRFRRCKVLRRRVQAQLHRPRYREVLPGPPWAGIYVAEFRFVEFEPGAVDLYMMEHLTGLHAVEPCLGLLESGAAWTTSAL